MFYFCRKYILRLTIELFAEKDMYVRSAENAALRTLCSELRLALLNANLQFECCTNTLLKPFPIKTSAFNEGQSNDKLIQNET